MPPGTYIKDIAQKGYILHQWQKFQDRFDAIIEEMKGHDPGNYLMEGSGASVMDKFYKKYNPAPE